MKPADRAKLTTALRGQVAKVADDLRAKMRTEGVVRERAKKLHADEQVGEDFDVWTDLLARRAAVLWVLKSVYVRVLEDRGLLSPGRILDVEAQQLFERLAPNLGETAFLRWVYRDLASTKGGLPELFGPQPAEIALPSDELSRELLAFWRHRDPDSGVHWSFAEEQFEGELMGDLYQDLDPVVKDRFALCQTPDFVRAFILDRTLTPAIETFGAEEVRLLDPACGSGHFLIDGLKRLVAATTEKYPDWEKKKLVTHCLERVVGIDLNDYACALARARLVMTAAEFVGVGTLAEASLFHPHVYWADGLEQVEKGKDTRGKQLDLLDPSRNESPRACLTRPEVRATLRKLLKPRFQAIVANPPYILEGDDARKSYHRERPGKRQRYISAYKQYHLSSPFIERAFQLGVNEAFVGLIVDNQFMKRDYGRPLVESVLTNVDLALLVDTSRAQIPHHGTPTLLIFARNRAPVADEVPVILSKRAEDSALTDPAGGRMWTGILAAAEDREFDDDFVFVRTFERGSLANHPWSIGDKTSASIVDAIESVPHDCLGDLASEIGRTTACGHDPVFLISAGAARALRADTVCLPFVDGAAVRDWRVSPRLLAVYPYETLGGKPLASSDPRVPAYLWRYRSLLAARTMFKKTIAEHGKVWFEHLEHYGSRVASTTKIAFASIATHNHFALFEGAALFNSKAPVITLSRQAADARHNIVATLSSSIACYWMKDRFQPRGATWANRNHPDPERAAYEFSVGGLKRYPVPKSAIASSRLRELGAELHGLAEARSIVLDPAYWQDSQSLNSSQALRARLAGRWQEHDRLRQRQVFVQEEIDWLLYYLCGLTSEPLLSPDGGPCRLPRGQRAFEIILGHRSFVRSRGRLLSPTKAECETGETTLPTEYVETTSRRENAIENVPTLAELESYMYKRLWRDTEENVPEEQYRKKLEQAQLWEAVVDRVAGAAACKDRPFSAGRIASDLMESTPFHVLLEVLTNARDFSIEEVVRRAIDEWAVPSHTYHIYSDDGLAKRAAWERTWARQRQEDEQGSPPMAEVLPSFSQGSRGKSRDYASDDYWRVRGGFDVPSERFVAFTEVPGRDRADTLYGWAGWTPLERLRALLSIDEELEDSGVLLADRIALLDSAWRLLPDVAREDATAASRLKAELQALVGTLGPSKEMLDDWRERFPPPSGLGSRKDGTSPRSRRTRRGAAPGRRLSWTKPTIRRRAKR